MAATIDSILKTSVKQFYDLQEGRIRAGNRIVQIFKRKLGIEPGQAEDDSDAGPLLDTLRKEFALLSEGVKKVTVKMPSGSLITEYGEKKLLEAYELQYQAELAHQALLEKELENYPLYTEFLKPIKGVGPLTSAALCSEIDFHKCNSFSSLWKYCGYDCVTWFVRKEVYPRGDNAPLKLHKRHPAGYTTLGPPRVTEDDWFILMDLEGNKLAAYGLPNDDEKEPGYGRGRSRIATHLEPREYVNRDGEIIQTRGITYNPFVKTKLFNMFESIIKAGLRYDISAAQAKKEKRERHLLRDQCSEYALYYADYKAWLEQQPQHQDKTPGHRHAMARRAMIKKFLQDLYVAGRTLEGLPVRAPYAEEKLGHKTS